MAKVLLVDNYLRDSRKIVRLKQEIRRIAGEEPITIHVSETQHIVAGKFDAMILSGGDAPLNRPEVAEAYSEIASWIRGFQGHILGICFGHQLLGLAFGGRVARLGRRFEGFYDIDIVERDGLFSGLPDKVKVYKSNIRVVTRVMPNFKLLAKGVDYEVEAFRHRERPIFGVQFHPENYSDTNMHGRRVLENFFDLI